MPALDLSDPWTGAALLLGVAFLPPLLFLLLLRSSERHRREPWGALGGAFLWGAFGAAVLAVAAELLLRGFLTGPDPWLGLPMETVVLAPLVEEAAKLAVLLRRRDADPEPEDGYIHGGAVGLGFAATENVVYVATSYVLGGEGLAAATAIYRGLVTVALHGATGALVGHAVWRARYAGRRVGPALAVLAAVVLHAAYNALAAVALPWATFGSAVVAMLAFLRMALRVRDLDRLGRRRGG